MSAKSNCNASNHSQTTNNKHLYAGLIFSFALCLSAIVAGLAPALLSGLLIYSMTVYVSGKLPVGNSKIAAIIVASSVVIIMVAFYFIMTAFIRSEAQGVQVLLLEMSSIIVNSKSEFPQWISSMIPNDMAQIKVIASEWLNSHAHEIRSTTFGAFHVMAQSIIAMVIGGIIAAGRVSHLQQSNLTFQQNFIIQRFENMATSFVDIVLSQTKISAINTSVTWLYLAVILPLFDVHLPMVGVMVVATFILGLIPIAGNVLSNIVITIISLGHSYQIAGASIVYLVLIHKLEYFINARIVGGRIKAKAWELLSAMLLMESLLGVSGLLMAPITYALLKREARQSGLINDE